MKKLLFFSLLCFFGLAVQAQTKLTHKKAGLMQDCYVMKEGRMMEMKGGQTVALNADRTLRNGTQISTTGTVKTRDGRTVTLHEGDQVLANGMVRYNRNRKN